MRDIFLSICTANVELLKGKIFDSTSTQLPKHKGHTCRGQVCTLQLNVVEALITVLLFAFIVDEIVIILRILSISIKIKFYRLTRGHIVFIILLLLLFYLLLGDCRLWSLLIEGRRCRAISLALLLLVRSEFQGSNTLLWATSLFKAIKISDWRWTEASGSSQGTWVTIWSALCRIFCQQFVDITVVFNFFHSVLSTLSNRRKVGPHAAQLLGEEMDNACLAFGLADVRVDFKGAHPSCNGNAWRVSCGEVIELQTSDSAWVQPRPWQLIDEADTGAAKLFLHLLRKRVVLFLAMPSGPLVCLTINAVLNHVLNSRRYHKSIK